MQCCLLFMCDCYIVEDEIVGEELIHLFARAIVLEVVAVKVAHVLDVLQHHHSIKWVLRITEQFVILWGADLIKFGVHDYLVLINKYNQLIMVDNY